jgi:hypothetical protein
MMRLTRQRLQGRLGIPADDPGIDRRIGRPLGREADDPCRGAQAERLAHRRIACRMGEAGDGGSTRFAAHDSSVREPALIEATASS